MRLLSIAVLATLPIAFGAPIKLAKTTEVAHTKRSESVAATVKALLDSNRLIARDGESQSDVMKRGGPTGENLLGDLGGGELSAADLAGVEALLRELKNFPKRGAISKRQDLLGLGGLLSTAGLGDLLGGGNLLGGVLGDGGSPATPPSPASPAPVSPPGFGTYGNSWPPSSGGPGDAGSSGSWPPSSGGPGDGGSGNPGNVWPGAGGPGNGDPPSGGAGGSEPGSGGTGSGSPGGYTYMQPPAYGGGK